MDCSCREPRPVDNLPAPFIPAPAWECFRSRQGRRQLPAARGIANDTQVNQYARPAAGDRLAPTGAIVRVTRRGARHLKAGVVIGRRAPPGWGKEVVGAGRCESFLRRADATKRFRLASGCRFLAFHTLLVRSIRVRAGRSVSDDSNSARGRARRGRRPRLTTHRPTQTKGKIP